MKFIILLLSLVAIAFAAPAPEPAPEPAPKAAPSPDPLTIIDNTWDHPRLITHNVPLLRSLIDPLRTDSIIVDHSPLWKVNTLVWQ